MAIPWVEEVPHSLIGDPVVPFEVQDHPLCLCPYSYLVESNDESQAVEGLCHGHWEEPYGHC